MKKSWPVIVVGAIVLIIGLIGKMIVAETFCVNHFSGLTAERCINYESPFSTLLLIIGLVTILISTFYSTKQLGGTN